MKRQICCNLYLTHVTNINWAEENRDRSVIKELNFNSFRVQDFNIFELLFEDQDSTIFKYEN